MKKSFTKYLTVCLLGLAVAVSARAGDINFYFTQYASGEQWQNGDTEFDNPNHETYATVIAPAYSVSMPYWSNSCAFHAFVDTSVAPGRYYVGTFSGGGDIYVNIY